MRQRLPSLGIVAFVTVSTCSSTSVWTKQKFLPVYGFKSKMDSFHKHMSSRRLSSSIGVGNGNPPTNSNLTIGTIIPRAAVSVVVRSPKPSYILVQRGKEPNKGLWSLPGGKLEAGEPTLLGSKRELWEECRLDPNSLLWYADGAITVTDSIHYSNCDYDEEPTDDDGDDGENGKSNPQTHVPTRELAFHYVIAQCFAQAPSELPLVASDDAADASWQTLDQIRVMVERGQATPGILRVIERVERMHQLGLFTL
jgi:ADP-ribose pyrophosphatase YjhB (NUDIX family)